MTVRVAALVPVPGVFAVVAGRVLLVVGVGDGLGQEPVVITATFLAYLFGRRLP